MIKKSSYAVFFVCAFIALALPLAAAHAQAPVDTAAAAATVADDTAKAAEAARKAALAQPFRQSLLFSPLDIAAIEKALAGQTIGDAVLKSGETTHIPERRIIKLSGVVFNSPSDWIVWLNGQKVLPGKVLPEIVDISVSRDIVHLKWFDVGMNKIISLSLRPHQTYDIVTGVLLPG